MRSTKLMVLMLIPFAVIRADEPSDAYLCIADLSTGFAFKNNEWVQANFKAEERYVVRERKDSDKMRSDDEWVVVAFDGNRIVGTCGSGPSALDFVYCEMPFGDFKMNIKNGRFISSYLAGYYRDNLNGRPDEDSHTSNITIGKCVSI